jgi:hypothetical protein
LHNTTKQLYLHTLLTTTMTNTESIKAVLIKMIIESGSNIPLSTLTGNIDLLIKSAKIDGMEQAGQLISQSKSDHPNTI